MDEKNTPRNSADHSEDRTELHVVETPKTLFPCLEVIAGPRTGYRFPLKEGKSTLGRSKGNDVVLDDSSVSRKHAELDVREGKVVLKDLGSRNGTRFQGERIENEIVCPQQSRIKIGIYEFQLLHEEPKGPPPEIPAQHEMSVRAAKPAPEGHGAVPGPGTDGKTEMVTSELPAEIPEGGLPAEVPQAGDQPAEAGPALAGSLKKFMVLGGVGLVVVLMAVAGFVVAKKFIFQKWKGKASTEMVETEGGQGEKEGVVSKTIAGALPGGEKSASVPVFINFTSTPIPAEIYFGSQKLGMTPYRQSTNLEFGKTYEARAVFNLPELNEVIEEKAQFRLKEGSQIVPVHFKGEIAMVKISAIPRDTQFYLEGYFDKDPYKAHPIKFSDIVFGKPFYVPYGKYVLELRQSQQLALSQTFIDEVVYRREFQLSAEMTNYTVNVKEEDLKIFPAEIRSVPSGAVVYIDDQEVGKTPYEGTLPLGNHVLLLKHDGYFDYTQPIQVTLNTSYVTEVKLQTSEAGQFINEASGKMKLERYPEALNDLVEALKHNTTPEEIGQINYLIGVSSLVLKRHQDAMDYFVKAMETPVYLFPARLGIAQIYFDRNDKIKALQLLIEVLIGSEDKEVRANAGALFQRISPFKSVIYINSDPPGATVFVNGMEVTQKTPTILYDLGVGSYRVVIQQTGYRSEERRVGK